MSLSGGSAREKGSDLERVRLSQGGYCALEPGAALDYAVEGVALEGEPEGLACLRVELALQNEPLISHVDLLHEGEVLEDHALSDPMRPRAEILKKTFEGFRVKKGELLNEGCCVVVVHADAAR